MKILRFQKLFKQINKIDNKRRKIKLGNTNIEISPVGLGCMGFTHAYGEPMKKEDAVKIIRQAYDYGFNV